MSLIERYRFHPLTCVAMTAAIGVLGHLNTRCQVYFGPGSTSVLKFGHGWPARYHEGSAPGPGQQNGNPNGHLPNYIWGHPEFNDQPEIMEQYNGELEGLSRTPWGLRSLAERSVVGIVLDALLIGIALHLLILICEATVYCFDRPAQSWVWMASFLVAIVTVAILASVYVPDASYYVGSALAVIGASILVTGYVLEHGVQ
ncbi:MAG: hypothetical protein KDA79_13495 [Planctomycetaceae bacterium]|nr:hypothetical protein [Planctomycetaceae bacterium]